MIQENAIHNTVHPSVLLARLTVERLLAGEPLPLSGNEVEANEALWNEKRACFVSIKTLDGALRGCIGTILPVGPGLDQEIIANAVAAAVRDPRFPPMIAEDLKKVTFSVDILTPPEPVEDMKDLDPKVWGVIVSKDYRRGVLLPDLEEIDAVEQQLDIAARKAGIRDMTGVKIERFRVERYSERVKKSERV